MRGVGSWTSRFFIYVYGLQPKPYTWQHCLGSFFCKNYAECIVSLPVQNSVPCSSLLLVFEFWCLFRCYPDSDYSEGTDWSREHCLFSWNSSFTKPGFKNQTNPEQIIPRCITDKNSCRKPSRDFCTFFFFMKFVQIWKYNYPVNFCLKI